MLEKFNVVRPSLPHNLLHQLRDFPIAAHKALLVGPMPKNRGFPLIRAAGFVQCFGNVQWGMPTRECWSVQERVLPAVENEVVFGPAI